MSSGHIRVLPEHVARKIAAGEVIERPQSAVRELLDNCLDAGATEISVWLHDGGNAEIVVQDNGSGMGREDLALCHLPHATSKIREEEDLHAIRSLGFRGEALAAIAAVSRLEIQSRSGPESSTLVVEGGRMLSLETSAAVQGTRISVRNLFYNLPARKQFLKRGATEFTLCQTTVLEKAMCFPHVHFRLFHDGDIRLNLPACTGPEPELERTWQCFGKDLGDRAFFHTLTGSTEGASIILVLARPDIYRHDRKMLQIYINKRRIQDFGLAQALEYGYTGYLPGGRYPLAFAWIAVDPHLIDVNIHPAKREAKLRNHGEIHHRLVELVQNHLRQKTIRQNLERNNSAPVQPDLGPLPSAPAIRPFTTHSTGPAANPIATDRPVQVLRSYTDAPVTWAAAEKPLGIPAAIRPLPAMPEPGSSADIQYLGQIFGCFLAYVDASELVLLDMHAAHERILFEDFLAARGVQELLVPRIVEVNDLARLWLRREQSGLEAMGLRLTEDESGTWQLHTCPAWMISAEGVFSRFLDNPFGKAMESVREMAAQAACRAAVKDGDRLDTETARRIIADARRLQEPRCPHGRPIWYRLSKDDLFTLIGRHV